MGLHSELIRDNVAIHTGASFEGAGGRSPPRKMKRKKKRKKREKKEKNKKITTYEVMFFQFFTSPVALKNFKKICPQEKVEMTLLDI